MALTCSTSTRPASTAPHTAPATVGQKHGVHIKNEHVEFTATATVAAGHERSKHVIDQSNAQRFCAMLKAG